MEQDEPPPIAALFLVTFDQKVGYTISWKRSLPDVDVDGVEYKSLPSGLHSVSQDLVYLVHNNCAGVSAFVQGKADQQHRNASFVAVGVLVPLSYGRLGRSWLHAEELRRLGEGLVKKRDDTRALELYWKQHRQDNAAKSDAANKTLRRTSISAGLKRKRTASGGVATMPDHPALSMEALLDVFGSLIFPLHRAALLRKRVLLLGSPPVQECCNWVYALSVFSSVPHSLEDVLQPEAEVEALFRIHPLFIVGIHDIPTLSETKGTPGWVACTTDDILGEKHQLYDLLVELPPSNSGIGEVRKWPKLRTADGKVVKATQRDLRRYRILRGELRRMRHAPTPSHGSRDSEHHGEGTPLVQRLTRVDQNLNASDLNGGENQVVEPTSWTAVAYNGFMWWASAGEQMDWEQTEENADRQLLEDLPDMNDVVSQTPLSSDTKGLTGGLSEAEETATLLTAYFHRLTSLILQTMADVVEEADDETEEGVEEDAIEVRTEDVRQMGLDTWSESDRTFVREAMRLYFGREAAVAEGGVRMCGVRIC